MSKNFDEILASGDEAAIETALAGMETTTDLLFDEDSIEIEIPAKEVTKDTVDSTKDEEKDVVEVDKTAVTPDPSTTETLADQQGIIEKDGKLYAEINADNAVIESKNGKHHVPYDVLANARQEAIKSKAELEEQLRANQQIRTEFDETKRVADLYSKQLGEAGLDPKLLPEQMLQDPELMAQVKEDYPQIGELVEALAAKVAQQTSANIAQPQEQDSFEQAFEQTAHLKVWQTSDIDKWEMAKVIDGKLADDPSFENKPLSERLAEVERRVGLAFGDEVTPDKSGAMPLKATTVTAPIPISPTDIGQQTSDVNKFSHILEQDAGNITSQMSSMTDAQIESLLEDAADFL